jgi:hypothetical protein
MDERVCNEIQNCVQINVQPTTYVSSSKIEMGLVNLNSVLFCNFNNCPGADYLLVLRNACF